MTELGWTTPHFGLSRGEGATTALAAIASAALYRRYGHPYLARGVVGDLAGFGVLGAVLVLRQARARHEALIALAGIGLVTVARPLWPLRVPDWAWWSLFTAAFTGYLLARKRTCD